MASTASKTGAKEKIRTSVMVMSDTHLANPFPDGIPADLPPIDVLIHCGDMTMYGEMPEFDNVLSMLEAIPAKTKLVIPGNHDMMLDREFMTRPKDENSWFLRTKHYSNEDWHAGLGEGNWQKAEDLWFSEDGRARKSGITMLKEGRHDFALANGALLKSVTIGFGILDDVGPLSGKRTARDRFKYLNILPAASGKHDADVLTFVEQFDTMDLMLESGEDDMEVYASPYQPEYCQWAFPYERWEDRFNTKDQSFSDANNIATSPVPSRSLSPDAPDNIDIMITHGPPFGRRDYTSDGLPAGCVQTLLALSRARPQLHCFGHIHEAVGAERLRWDKLPAPLPSDASDKESSRPTMKSFKATWSSESVVDAIEKVSPPERVADGRVIELDLSSTSISALQPDGAETMVLNASFMNVRYQPTNPVWLLHLDLPSRE